ncbi:MAG TPA: hypothetical protein VFA26_21645 [Gemmataceae bacterium]|nr:hypothetical protein [Gemmataceae bacterium]
MLRTTLGAALLAAATLALAAHSTGAEDRPPTVKEIMKKINRPSTGLLPDTTMDLKEDEPDWKEIQTHTKEMVALAKALGKNAPPKGSKESWEKQTRAYLANVEALDAAARKKDKAAALAAVKKLAPKAGCAGCHQAHRPTE